MSLTSITVSAYDGSININCERPEVLFKSSLSRAALCGRRQASCGILSRNLTRVYVRLRGFFVNVDWSLTEDHLCIHSDIQGGHAANAAPAERRVYWHKFSIKKCLQSHQLLGWLRFWSCWCVGSASVSSASSGVDPKKAESTYRERRKNEANTVVCSCYISSTKRIIFEVARSLLRTTVAGVICLKTLNILSSGAESECVLMLPKEREKRYFCINLQLARSSTSAVGVSRCTRRVRNSVIWYFCFGIVFVWWKWYPLNEMIYNNFKSKKACCTHWADISSCPCLQRCSGHLHSSISHASAECRERSAERNWNWQSSTHLGVIKSFNYLRWNVTTETKSLMVILASEEIARRRYTQQVSTRLKGLILNTTKYSPLVEMLKPRHNLHLNILTNIIR